MVSWAPAVESPEFQRVARLFGTSQGDFAKSATCAKRAKQIFNEAPPRAGAVRSVATREGSSRDPDR